MTEQDWGSAENARGTIARAIGCDSLGNIGGTEFRADRKRGSSLYLHDRLYFQSRSEAETWRDAIETAEA